MSCEPAFTIIQNLGGPSAVSNALGIARQAVHKWKTPKERNGTGGIIPLRHHVALLDYARAHDIPLTAADFLPLQEFRRSA